MWVKDMWKCFVLFLQLCYESEIISKSSYQEIMKVRKKIFKEKEEGQILTVLAYLEANSVHVTKVWPMRYKTRPGQALVYSDKMDSLLKALRSAIHPLLQNWNAGVMLELW